MEGQNMTLNTTMSSNITPTSFDMHENAKKILNNAEESIGFIIGLAGIVANFWALLAVLHVRSGLTLHYKLIASLAVSDMLVSVSVVTLFIQKLVFPKEHPDINLRKHSTCLYLFIKALNNASLNISLLNLMAMALDHYLAILRPLHYPTMFNNLRANILIVFLWIVSMILGFSNFFTGYQFKPKPNQPLPPYCERVERSKYQEEYTVFANALLCFVIMIVVYGKIFLETQRTLKRTPVFQEMQKNRKALITTLLILGTFIICWLPNCLFQVIMIIIVHVDMKKAWELVNSGIVLKLDPYFFILLLLNSLLDPVIYAIRIREIRFGYKKLCYHCCKCCMDRPRRNDPNADYTTHCTMLLEERKYSHSSYKDDMNCIVNNKHH